MTGKSVLCGAVLVLAACGEVTDGEAPWLGAPGEGVMRTVTVDVDGAPTALPVEDFDGTLVLEDDIVLDPSQVIDVRASGAIDAAASTDEQALAAVKKARLWPHGVVYYKLSDGLSDVVKQRARAAMDAWEASTVVRFVPADANRTDYVLVVPFSQPYCRSTISHTGGRQFMWLNERICTKGLIEHELGHTLGLFHEQSRMDRDEHVEILWKNIEPSKKSNFNKYRSGRDIGPYNVHSLMHYGSHDFSANGAPTIVLRETGLPYGRMHKEISDLDAAGMNRIYGPLVR